MESETRAPEIRFEGFTDPWEQRKLGDLVLIERGGSPRPIDAYITEGPAGLNWVKIGDAPSMGRYITSTSEKIKPEGLSKTRQVYPGDLVLSNSMSFGRPYIMAVEGCIHDGWLLIRDAQNQFDPVFLCHMLGTSQMLEQYRMFASGSTVNNLNKELVGNATVPVPNRNEQVEIGKYLDELDNLITLHQRKYDKLCVVKKSMLDKMFPKPGALYPEIRFEGFTDPWEQRKLGEFGSVAMCKRIYKEQTSEQGDVPFFKIGTFGADPDAFISNELFDYFKRTYPYPTPGTLLISAAGSIGRVVEYQGEKAYFQDSNIVWLEHDHRLNDTFLKPLYSQIEWGLEGSTIKRLYNKDLLSAEVTIPGSREQKEIGRFFAKLDDLITLHQRKLELLKNVKKSLLEKMFV
ncbi:type I restriction-modification system specificity subunit [Eggerthella sp. CAG:368]|nr:type I restriction-modification system specificity subunit [Eggerthella sp. CAG:368]